MELLLIFTIIGIVLALGFLAEIFFRKTGVPDVLILIFFGIFLRYGLGLADPSFFPDLTLFTTFALLFVLFQGSLSIDFRTLMQSASSALKITLATFLVSVILITGVAMLLSVMGVLQFNLLSAILIGTILGGTSSMVIVPMLQNMGLAGKTKSVLTLESALSDVLCILATLTIVEIIVTGSVEATSVTRSLFASLGLSVVVGIGVGILWVFLLERFTSLSRAYVVNIGIVLIVYAFVESDFVGASGPIACLVFGLMLRNSKSILSLKKKEEEQEVKPILTTEAKNFYSEISFFLKATFFVYLGILIDLQNYIALIIGLLFMFIIYFVRPYLVRGIFRGDSDVNPQEKVILEVMIPKGLAAAILAQFAANELIHIPSYEVISQMLTAISMSAILFSILLTSVLVFTTERGWFHGFFRPKSQLASTSASQTKNQQLKKDQKQPIEKAKAKNPNDHHDYKPK